MIPTINVHLDAIEKAMNTGHILATEVADYLAKKGVPFREAHDIVGQMVQLADDKQRQIHELTLAELQSFSTVIESDITNCLSMEAAIKQKNVIGATSFEQLKMRLKQIKEDFKW